MISAWIAVACSGGPGTMEMIERHEHTGHVAAAVGWAVLAVAAIAMCIRARRLRKSAVALALAGVLHPGIWMGARHGDCGFFVRDFAWPCTAAAIVLAVAAVAVTELRLRREL